MPEFCRAALVEAFASAPFEGNGAAVVLLKQAADAAWMQALAGSLNQSETAFLHRGASGQWRLRWFTPTCEVPLCGHATLAATIALHHWQVFRPGDALSFASRSGKLTVGLGASGSNSASIVLPSGPLEEMPPPGALAQQLGLPIQRYWASALGYRVALLDEQANLQGMENPSAHLQGQDRQGLVVMQPTTSGGEELLGGCCDYQLRFFAPGLGIPEDPVTGSAHALVAPWWMEELQRPRVRGWQASARRGGMLCEREAPGLIRLTGTGQLLWDGQINASGQHCDPDSWERSVHL